LLTGTFIGVLGLGLAIAWMTGSDTTVARQGDPAPEFTVELLQGGEFALSRHLADDGRPIIINLWASWCAPCREEIPTLSSFAEANPRIAVLGVAVEDKDEDSIALASALNPSHPLAHGNPGFEAAYPNFGLPVTYFVDSEGIVIEVFNGILTEEALEERVG
jgi:thiol-disulfide isomerase/thioredoxin